MDVYKGKSFCNTRECPLFNTTYCNKNIVANRETRDEANEFGLPLDLRVYDLDECNIPIGCKRYEELNKK